MNMIHPSSLIKEIEASKQLKSKLIIYTPHVTGILVCYITSTILISN